MKLSQSQLEKIIKEEIKKVFVQTRLRGQNDREAYSSGVFEEDTCVSESDNPHPAQYDAPQGSKRDKDLDRCKKLYKDGKIKQAAKCRQKMEKPHMTESIDDAIEEALLDEVLDSIEKVLNEKRKKSGKSPKGLSKKVKKSLDKKADKRCLTRGSVYAEFRKGLSAFLSSGSRKGMTAHQWAYARVNSAQPSKKWAVVKKRKKCPKKKK